MSVLQLDPVRKLLESAKVADQLNRDEFFFICPHCDNSETFSIICKPTPNKRKVTLLEVVCNLCDNTFSLLYGIATTLQVNVPDVDIPTEENDNGRS